MTKRSVGIETIAVIYILCICGLLALVYLVPLTDPFSNRVQKETFIKVAALMFLEIDPAKLPPQILKGCEVTNEYNDSVWGFKVGDKRSNIYDPVNRAIILDDKSARIHNLAHEYAHYFQYEYWGVRAEDMALAGWDMYEIYAITIQDNFR